MEKLLCSKDIEQIFQCSRRKAIELMREMNPINITQKPGAKKKHLLVPESELNAWMNANRYRPDDPKEQCRRAGRKPRQTRMPPIHCGEIPNRIPRRKPEKPGKAKSPGDVAASTGAVQKGRTHYITTSKEAQVPC